MASYTKKIALNTVVQIVGKFFTTLISIVMLAALSRYLGVNGFGEYTTVFAFLGFFAILGDFGLFNISVREVSREPEKSKYIIGNIVSLRIILALLFLVVAPLVAYFIPNYNLNIKLGILIALFSSFFILLNQIFASIFQVNLRMDRLVIGDVISRLVLLVCVLFFVNFEYPFVYFILANVLCNLVFVIISYIFSRKFIKFKFLFDWNYIKYIIKEALPLGVVIVLGLIYFKIDTIMLSIMKDSEAVGIYGAPYKILEILITIPTMFVGSVFPLAAIYFKNKDERFAISFKKTFDFISIIAFPILIGIFVLAKPIIAMILGNEFINSALVLQYLIFAVFIIFYGTIMGNFIIASNLQKKLVIIYVISVLLNITLNLFLIPKYSYIGSSISTISTEYFVCMSAFLILYNNLKLLPNMRVFFKALISSTIMGVFVYYFINYNLFLLIIIGGCLYLTSMILLKGITKESIKQILR